MASDTIVLRKIDGSGAGVIFKTRKEADAFLKIYPNYAEESPAQAAANQRTADENVAKARKPAENKAVEPAENKSKS